MSSRTDCPISLRTETGKKIAESFMTEMGMDVNSEKDRMSFYTMFGAWETNNPSKDFPDNVKELEQFDCRIKEGQQLDLFSDASSLDPIQTADETFGEALIKDMAKSKKTREMLKE